ncbi:Ig-like domain-containing protein [Bacteroides sp. 1001136B_160425_E2]|uniref:Ig-like domain-containing protein n=1 Tax=Bacteroides sp. 1001136B_160425_E2 TaxID=2787083 RepID=UPI00189EAC92|nr:Ig-like domain-containing protein [Bacteroides sp. 1001136B_160425_E2]
MKKQLLYLMFAMTAICAACSDDDEIYQAEAVKNPVTGVSVENELMTEEGVITLEGLGTTTTLHVSVIPDNAGNLEEYSFRFGSSNVEVFTVDREGVITSVASGEAELTVTLVDNANVVRFQSKYRVAVDYVVKVEEIIVAGGAGSLRLTTGSTYDLNNNHIVLPDDAADKSVSYRLKEESEAILLENGVITAIKAGNAVVEIIANDGGGASTELAIEVRDASDIDVQFKFTTVVAYSMGGNLLLNLRDATGNVVGVQLDGQTTLPSGEYSKDQIGALMADLGAAGLGKREPDVNNPGSFTVQYDAETQNYTIEGVFNWLAAPPYSAITMGFEYTGRITITAI